MEAPLIFSVKRCDFVAPGQVIEVNNEENYQLSGLALLFHPDLIRGTALGKKMSQYFFFSYDSHEAPHLSLKEQQIYIKWFLP